jgi:hypothetical protein
MATRRASRRARRSWAAHAFRPPQAKPLLRGTDNGPPVRLDPPSFRPASARAWLGCLRRHLHPRERASVGSPRVPGGLLPAGPTAPSCASNPVATRALCPFDPPRLNRLSVGSSFGPASNGLGWAAFCTKPGGPLPPNSSTCRWSPAAGVRSRPRCLPARLSVAWPRIAGGQRTLAAPCSASGSLVSTLQPWKR